jgi:mannosylglucosylglycerate synthase
VFLHIALIHYSAPPVVGSVESVLAQHARLMAQAGHTVRILAARGQPISDQIQFITLPLIDSRHPRVLAAKAELDRGVVPADFEPLTSEIIHTLQAALTDVDVLIAHNVCSLSKNLMLTAAIHRLDRPRQILWHHDLAWTTPRYRAELHDSYLGIYFAPMGRAARGVLGFAAARISGAAEDNARVDCGGA